MQTYDVVTIGNALIDKLALSDDHFLMEHQLTKNAMTLVDAPAIKAIERHLTLVHQSPGGSAANTAAGIASLTGQVAFIGKIASDDLGQSYRHMLAEKGVTFPTAYFVQEGENRAIGTGRCLVVVTPDGARTMQTYLGACVELSPADIAPEIVENTQILYLEGYLWDRPKTHKAFMRAAEIAKKAGKKVALALSDRYCVERHREGFLKFIQEYGDFLICNEEEVKALFTVESLDMALQHVTHLVPEAAITLGAQGAILVGEKGVLKAQAFPVKQVFDTTGAGDLFASGLLFGLTHGYDRESALELAVCTASKAVQHFGAWPPCNLSRLVLA